MADLSEPLYTMSNGVRLHLKVKRTARRNYIFRFRNADTLEISVFKRSTQAEIKRALDHNQDMLDKLYKKALIFFQAALDTDNQLPKHFYFMGQSLPIIYQSNAPAEFSATQITLPDHLTPDAAKKLIGTWLYQQAEATLLPHLKDMGAKIGLNPTVCKLTKGKSYWGVCSHHNHIRLNWRLILAPLWIQEYVMVHELCHIQHKNHSRAFWQSVHHFFPQTTDARKWLKMNTQTLQQFG